MRRRFVASWLASLWLAASAVPAQAEWNRIETPEFALQADMEPDALRAIGAQLVDHDRLLRQVLKVSGPGRGRRIEMVIYGEHAELVAASGMPAFAGGFFSANPIENFALLPARASEADYDAVETARHEYTHYFMARHLGTWQPAWYIEGLASFFETARRGPDGLMRYGRPSEPMLAFREEFGGLPFADIGTMPDFRGDPRRIGRFYAQAWLVTSHYYMGGRQAGAIGAYLDAFAKGPTTAPGRISGGDAELDRDLDAWLAAGVPPEIEVAIPPADPAAIDVRPLSPGEIRLVDLRLEIYRLGSKINGFGDAVDAWSSLTSRTKEIVTAHPNDRSVGLFAAKMMLLADIGEITSDEIGAMLDPAATGPEDRILQARLMTRRADEGPPAEFHRTIAAARATLNDVLRANPDNVDALVAMFENIRQEEGASPAATAYLAKALAIDPANAEWRMTLLELYMRDQRKAEAIALLRTIVNLPHAGTESRMAADLLRKLTTG